MAHNAQCGMAGLSLAVIESERLAGRLSGMGYHFLREHVTSCPRGCRPIQAGQLPPMQRYAVQARPNTPSDTRSR